jgi:hypothetical protein
MGAARLGAKAATEVVDDMRAAMVEIEEIRIVLGFADVDKVRKNGFKLDIIGMLRWRVVVTLMDADAFCSLVLFGNLCMTFFGSFRPITYYEPACQIRMTQAKIIEI